MSEKTRFEHQVEEELHGMVGPIPRFDAVEIAETASVAPRARLLRWPRARHVVGLAAAVLPLVVGVGILSSLVPSELGPVRIDGQGTYATIGEAVADAVDDDVILVGPGVYEGTVEVTTDIEIRGVGEPDSVVFNIPGDGPAFRLREADAVISGITFFSWTPAEGADRQPAIHVVGGAPILEDLVARSDVPDSYHFVRLFETVEGAVIRRSISTGDITANRGAQAVIEDNVLLSENRGGPAVGIELERADVFLVIKGNELNTVSIPVVAYRAWERAGRKDSEPRYPSW